MSRCEDCIYWKGGITKQSGASLCAKNKPMRYNFPEKMGDEHGYVPARKGCFTDTPPPPKPKRKVVKTRRAKK